MKNIAQNLKLKLQNTEVLCKGKFSCFCRTFFTDKLNQKKNWEFIIRTNSNKAAVINAQTDNKVILVKQFRIPLKKFSLEFPAGLIDEGETPTQAAIRELLEETGYHGEVIKVSPSVCTSPGLTGEEIYFIEMKIIGEQSKQMLDDTEEIEVLEFEKTTIKEDILTYLENNSETVLDSKVWSAFFEK